MAPITRSASKKQHTNDICSRNGQGATVPPAVRTGVKCSPINTRAHSETGEVTPTVNEDVVGGVDDKKTSAKAKGPEADEASQQCITRERSKKPTRRPTKARRQVHVSRKSRKKADRRANEPGSTGTTPTNRGLNANDSATKKVVPHHKRKREDVDAPTTGTLEERKSQSNRRSVRRRVDETSANARIFRNATNSNTAASAYSFRPPGAPEEANATETDDGDDLPRFTRVQKGKYTEREGDAADGLVELSVPRLFSEDEAKAVEEPTSAGIAFDGPSEEEEEKKDDSIGEPSLDEFLSSFEPSTECRFKESDVRSTLTEED